jgi:hypothetical protein
MADIEQASKIRGYPVTNEARLAAMMIGGFVHTKLKDSDHDVRIAALYLAAENAEAEKAAA